MKLLYGIINLWIFFLFIFLKWQILIIYDNTRKYVVLINLYCDVYIDVLCIVHIIYVVYRLSYGPQLVRTSHKLGPQLVRTSHKPGPQLVGYLGFGPQLTNTDQFGIFELFGHQLYCLVRRNWQNLILFLYDWCLCT
jgi:hypothetical protein